MYYLVGLVALVGSIISTGLWPSGAEAKMSCSSDVLCISAERQGHGTWLTAINKLQHMPVTFSLQLKMMNLKVTKGKNTLTILQPGETRQLIYLAPKSQGRWRYSYKFNWAYGDLNAKHDENHLYRLPFADEESFRVSQSCNGEFSHRGEEEYAIDFGMPLNTPVHAARSGVVAAVKQDSDRGGPDRSFEDDANYVFIQHADGTLAYYFHLAANSVVVQPGSRIAAGEMIARSGNTGFSSGPHLHFEVASPARAPKSEGGVNSKSLLTPFETSDGTTTCPKAGRRLRVKR
jgi:murein DD-endopeptidase MepM/ murein hydrolase activator NlpD